MKSWKNTQLLKDNNETPSRLGSWGTLTLEERMGRGQERETRRGREVRKLSSENAVTEAERGFLWFQML